MILYLVKMTACALLLYVMYALLLEKEKMHRIKRFYLLFSLIFSMTVPLVTLTVNMPAINTIVSGWNNIVRIADIQLEEIEMDTQVEAIPTTTSIHYSLLLLVAYVSITSIFLFRLLKNCWTMLAKGRNNAFKDYHGAKIVLIDEKNVPYSFGPYIFANREAYTGGQIPDEILLHECTHVRQQHSNDILFIELLIAFGWFNPVFYLYRNKIRQNHEFLADDAVIGSDRKLISVYQTLLINHIPQKKNMILTSNFYFNFLITKKRIIMMTKTTSKKKGWCRGIALIPVFFAAICIFSNCDSSNTQTSVDATEDKVETRAVTEQQLGVFERVEEMPEFPGGDSELLQFLNTNVKYPQVAQENGIQGRVVCTFVVNKDGSISDIQVLRSVDPSLDKEAVRVINLMPKWTPGKQRGNVVAARFTLPVTFSLP